MKRPTVKEFKAGMADAIASELVDRQSRHIYIDDLDDIVDSVYDYITQQAVRAVFGLSADD